MGRKYDKSKHKGKHFGSTKRSTKVNIKVYAAAPRCMHGEAPPQGGRAAHQRQYRAAYSFATHGVYIRRGVPMPHIYLRLLEVKLDLMEMCKRIFLELSKVVHLLIFIVFVLAISLHM